VRRRPQGAGREVAPPPKDSALGESDWRGTKRFRRQVGPSRPGVLRRVSYDGLCMAADSYRTRVALDEAELDDLAARLAKARLPRSGTSSWERGTPMPWLAELATDWRAFDPGRLQVTLDQLTHIVVTVDGLSIHAVHAPGSGKASVPLLLTHGWPSSFLEYVVLLLAYSRHQALDAGPGPASPLQGGEGEGVVEASGRDLPAVTVSHPGARGGDQAAVVAGGDDLVAHPHGLAASSRSRGRGTTRSGAFGQLPVRADPVAGVAVGVGLQVVLVLALGLPERSGGHHLGDHVPRP
jgi:Epoxide hydrolase N terminus